MSAAKTQKEALFEYLVRLADDQLVLAHRLSEWCGHAPMLEEDLALPNISLDLLGQARALYSYAGLVEDKGRNEDQIAYVRLEKEYKNLLLLERENGDFAKTMLRLFLYSAFMQNYWEALLTSSDETLAAIAAKAIKEVRYHVRHSAEWVIRLGDGTQESAARLADALDDLSPYCAEMFESDAVCDLLVDAGIAVDLETVKDNWTVDVRNVFNEAMLAGGVPLEGHQRGGRQGEHTEAMGFLLADLQYMQRTFPDMSW